MGHLVTRTGLSFLLFTSRCLVSAVYDNRIIPDAKDGEFTKFRTRPDLQVPIWDIQVYDETRLAPGYWFVSPYENVHPPENDKPPWVTPCIYDTNGELLWSAGDMFDHRNTQDFRLSNVLGHQYLTMIWQDGGVGVTLDESYEKKYEVFIGVNMDTLNIHDFNIVDNGTRALNFKKYWGEATKEDSEAFGYEGGECKAEWQIFYERDVTTPNWDPVFEWNAYDHIPLEDSTFRADEPASNVCEGAYWDFMHANAVDKCPDGSYVLSARHADTIYNIRPDGKIAWRLGGPKDDFTHDFKFSRQHHVRCRSQNETHTVISFLDNAVAPDAQPRTNEFSRGLLLAVDARPDKMEASIVAKYDHPRKKLTDGRGSMQVLPNDNVLMGWSGGGKHSEYTADGTLLMEAKFIPGYLRTYRTYKFPFVGRPQKGPDVLSEVVEKDGDYKTDIYVSWNGATEVKYWNFYKSDSEGVTLLPISSTPKTLFETKATYDGYASFVIAEALDADGKSLGMSKVTRTTPMEKMPSDVVSSELDWLQQPSSTNQPLTNAQASTLRNNRIMFFFGGFLVCAGIVLGLWIAKRIGFGCPPSITRREQAYEPINSGEKFTDAQGRDSTPRDSEAYASESGQRNRSSSMQSV